MGMGMAASLKLHSLLAWAIVGQQGGEQDSPPGMKGMPPMRGKLLYCWPPPGGAKGPDMVLLLLLS